MTEATNSTKPRSIWPAYGGLTGREGAAQAGDTGEYFRRLRKKLRVSLLAAYLFPLAILSFYFHFQFDMTMKRSGKLQLVSLAESQRNTVDLFLQERIVNIFNLFHDEDFTLSPSQEDIKTSLSSLRMMSNAIVDVVFLNIINHAGDAIGESGIITQSTRADDRFVHTTITDTGKGVTSEELEKIFMPFFTTKEVGKRTGLGFSLSIIESMGERIGVKCVPGEGKLFYHIFSHIDAEEDRYDNRHNA